MRDFNTVCSELVKHLRLSVQRQDGEIWWYKGTLELITELLSIAEPFNNLSKPFKTNADRIRAMSDEELAVQLVNEQVVIVKQLLLTLDNQMLNEYETEVKKEWDEIVQEKLAWLGEEAET